MEQTAKKKRKRRTKLERLRDDLEEKQIQFEMFQFGKAQELLESTQFSAPSLDPDESKWTDLMSGSEDPRLVTEESLETLRSQARELATTNPHGRRIMRNVVIYIIGPGMTFTPKIENETLKAKAVEVWEKWQKENKWGRKEREIIRRGFRDGELFIRFFNRITNLEIRFMEPDYIRDPDGNVTYGILTEDGDVETPIIYFYVPPGRNNAEFVPAQEVLHIKMDQDSDVKRGVTQLAAIRIQLRQYETWIKDRMTLNKVRAAVALIRTHEGSGPAKIASFADGKATSTYNSPHYDNPVRRQRIEAGTIIDTNPGTKYEFMAPDVQAADVQHDGRALLLSCAAGAGQSEPMVTADASNANYASTMVAEAPAVKDFEDWQRYFTEEFEGIWDKVMEWAEEYLMLPEEVREAGVKIDAPRILARDRDKEAGADEKYVDMEVLSVQEICRREGVKYDTMQIEIDEHETRFGASRREAQAPPLPPGFPGTGNTRPNSPSGQNSGRGIKGPENKEKKDGKE